jgi:hypothetical protein
VACSTPKTGPLINGSQVVMEFEEGPRRADTLSAKQIREEVCVQRCRRGEVDGCDADDDDARCARCRVA